jgi:hypothetical protein
LQEQPVVNAGEFPVTRIAKVLGRFTEHTPVLTFGGQQIKAFYFITVNMTIFPWDYSLGLPELPIICSQ